MIPQIVTDPIELELTEAVPVTIRHGLGYRPSGWLVIWQDAPVQLYEPESTPLARWQLTLTPSASARVRIVLIS